MKERWAEIKTLFNEVFDLGPEERAAALARPGVDPWVRAQVDRLLAASAGDAGVLDRPAELGPLTGEVRSAPFAGRVLGAYRVVREIGRGGMGTVYEAVRHDAEFQQRVAIKTLRIGLDIPELVNQFRRERSILAALQHPNIAALLDGGVTDDGIPYIVLEYVDGVTIDRYCEENRLGLRDRLDLFRHVLDAVQYAHRQLVIHRDIKPGNILVTRDGHVKLLDFGVARLIHPDGREMTQPGTAGITPAYASPEQLRGDRASTSTDVYSLALVLYRLLTGRSPVAEERVSPAELLAALTTDTLPPPSTDPAPESATTMGLGSVDRLRRLLHGELDAVILKALRLEPERRYPSVEALADDLLRYLKGLPVTARPDTAWYRASRFVRRRRGLVGGAIAATLALVAGTGVAAWQARRAEGEARRATRIATFLQEVIGASAPLGSFHAPRLGPGSTLAELIDSAAGRIDPVTVGEPEVQVVLHHLFGQVYRSQERSEAAAAQFAMMARLARPTFGPGLADVVSLAALGAAAMQGADWNRADSVLAGAAEALAGLDRRKPDRYGALLIQFGYLPALPWPRILAGIESQVQVARSGVRARRGDLPGAIADLRRIVARADSTQAPNESRAEAMTALGQFLLASAGDRGEAARLLRSAQRLVDSLPDPDVVSRAEILWTLVATATVSGREADSLGQEVLRIYEKATGTNSLAVANQLWVRGASARLRGDTLTQRTSLIRAMSIVAAHPSPPAELRQNVTMEYARTLWLAGNVDSAVTLAGQVYHERQADGGFPVAEAGQLLGALLRIRAERTPATREVDYRAAEPVLLQADSIVRAILPPTHYWPRTTAGTLVRLYRSWGKETPARRFMALLPDADRRALASPTK